jgi:hypothetical protein
MRGDSSDRMVETAMSSTVVGRRGQTPLGKGRVGGTACNGERHHLGLRFPMLFHVLDHKRCIQ